MAATPSDPIKESSYEAIGCLLLLSYGLVLGLYYRCISALDRQFAQLDVKVTAKCKDPYDDPYNRY